MRTPSEVRTTCLPRPSVNVGTRLGSAGSHGVTASPLNCEAARVAPVTRTGTTDPSMVSRSERHPAGNSVGVGVMRRPGMPSSAIPTGAATVSPVDSRVASCGRTPVMVTRMRRPVMAGAWRGTVTVAFSAARLVIGGSSSSRTAPSTCNSIDVGIE